MASPDDPAAHPTPFHHRDGCRRLRHSRAAGQPARRPRPSPDVVVVGVGCFGLWTALNLQRLGARVTVVDAYGAGNSRQTSGGETRGVRSSYGDRPHGRPWTRWANEAIRRWIEWGEIGSERLRPRVFFTTGDLILRSTMRSPQTRMTTLAASPPAAACQRST